MDLKFQRKGAYSLLIRDPAAFKQVMTRVASLECTQPEEKVFLKDSGKKIDEGKISVGEGYASNVMHSWCENDFSTQTGDTELNG